MVRIRTKVETGQTGAPSFSWPQEVVLKNLEKHGRTVIFKNQSYPVIQETTKAVKIRMGDTLWFYPSKREWYTKCGDEIEIWVPKKACEINEK